MGIRTGSMSKISTIAFILFLITANAFAQKAPVFSLCGKTGDCSMTWDEFLKCKKELITNDKKLSIGSFIVTIQKGSKKDTVFVQYPCKGYVFSKSCVEAIEELHKDKKMGGKVLIEGVEILQSGQSARKGTGMTIRLY